MTAQVSYRFTKYFMAADGNWLACIAQSDRFHLSEARLPNYVIDVENIDVFDADQDCQMDSVYRTNVFDQTILLFMDVDVKKDFWSYLGYPC